MGTREHHLFFSSKDNRTVILTGQDFFPDRTANGDLLFTFSSNVLDFRRSPSSYLKFGSQRKDSSLFYRKQGRLATRKSRSAGFKNSFSIVKLVSGVSCFKSSNICLICSRSSLKRLKDINKSAISTLWIIPKVNQNSVILWFHGISFSKHVAPVSFDFVARGEVHLNVY